MADLGRIEVDATVAGRGVQVRLRVEPGERVALLGPNGAGKSTALGLIAGTVRPSAGTVRVDGQDLATPWTPPHARRVGLLAQRPLLFPHLRVVDNVAYGLRARGVRRQEARELALATLGRMEPSGALVTLADRRGWELSGGQAQRIAVARAAVTDPVVLCLDEPLTGVDADRADELRRELLAATGDRTTLIATHDLLDVLALTDRIVQFDAGRVVADGPAEELLARPPSAYLAGFVGVNLLHGNPGGRDGLDLGCGQYLVGLAEGPGPHRWAAVEPRAVALAEPALTSGSATSQRNRLAATVSGLRSGAGTVRVDLHLRCGQALSAEVTPAAVADLGIATGKQLDVVIKATQVRLY